MPRLSLHSTAPAALVALLATAPAATRAAEPPSVPAAAGTALVLAGSTVLRALPSPVAAEIAWLPAGSEVAVVERHGRWLRVRAGGRTGWIDTAGGGRPAVDAALEAARAALGPAGRGGRLGGFALLTDVADAELLGYLARIADQVPGAFAQRYGLPVSGAGPDAGGEDPLVRPVLGTVVLFAGEADYRAFTRSLAALSGGAVDPDELAGLGLAGQTAPEVASLAVQGSTPRQVARTLVHESVHLLVRRTLGEAVPVWLDEGLAGDLELGRIEPDGRLLPAVLRPRRAGTRVRLEGPLAALGGLLDDARHGRLERFADLAALDRTTFQRSLRRQQLYALTALWVRYLLDGEDGELAPGFHAWLAAAAADPALLTGAPGAPPPPADRLGRSPAELDRGFRAWLHDLARRLRSG